MYALLAACGATFAAFFSCWYRLVMFVATTEDGKSAMYCNRVVCGRPLFVPPASTAVLRIIAASAAFAFTLRHVLSARPRVRSGPHLSRG